MQSYQILTYLSKNIEWGYTLFIGIDYSILVIIFLSLTESEGIFSNFFTWDCTVVASFAVFSHTLADSIIAWGAPLYYPFSKRKHVHFPLIGGRLRYDNAFANKAIEISAIFLLIIVMASGVFAELDSAPVNFIKLIQDIIYYF
ncbi:MAG: metal-dependent hydrolase [Methanofastidiosum sp.]